MNITELAQNVEKAADAVNSKKSAWDKAEQSVREAQARAQQIVATATGLVNAAIASHQAAVVDFEKARQALLDAMSSSAPSVPAPRSASGPVSQGL